MIHHVFANKSNIGDWLSAKGIQSLLGQPVVEHLCDEPFVPETLEALSRTTDDDVIVIGGGGLLMDYFDPFWNGLAALELRARVCWWGLGCVDLKDEPSLPRSPVLALAAGADLCVVRDELSRAFLRIDREPVPCPSTCVDLGNHTGRDVLHVASYTTVGPAHYEHMVRLTRQFAKERGLAYRETSNRIEPTERHLAECLARYAASAVVVSSGLHGCVIGLSIGAKVIAVSGDRKIEAFMETAGLEDWVLPQDRVGDVPGLLEAVDQQPSVEGFFKEARLKNRAIAEAVLTLATDGQ